MPSRRRGHYTEEVTLTLTLGQAKSSYELLVRFYQDGDGYEIEDLVLVDDESIDMMWLLDDYQLKQAIIVQLEEKLDEAA